MAGLSQADLARLLEVDELIIKAVEREEEFDLIQSSCVFSTFVKVCKYFKLNRDLKKLSTSLKKINFHCI